MLQHQVAKCFCYGRRWANDGSAVLREIISHWYSCLEFCKNSGWSRACHSMVLSRVQALNQPRNLHGVKGFLHLPSCCVKRSPGYLDHLPRHESLTDGKYWWWSLSLTVLKQVALLVERQGISHEWVVPQDSKSIMMSQMYMVLLGQV